MSQPEQQQIDSWIKMALDGLARTEEDFKSGFYEEEDISIQSVHVGTALLYAILARARFLNGDPIAEVRTEFATAARYILKSFTMAYDEKDPDYQGEKADWVEVGETIALDGFNFALMAADFTLTEELAGWFRDPPDGVCMDIEVNRYAHALKHALLGGWRQARELLTTQRDTYLGRPSKRNDYRKNYYTMSIALLGIVNRDAALFNKGLQMQLEFYQGDAQGELKDTDEEFICDYAVALANLGLRHGLTVTVEHDTLPQGLMI